MRLRSLGYFVRYGYIPKLKISIVLLLREKLVYIDLGIKTLIDI